MSYRCYPVTETELFCDDYIVKINGKEVALDVARVSAVPFNRRWPGHQRQIEQSECVQFLSLATDGPLSFEILPKLPFDEVKIRPRSLGITPEVTQDGRILFTLEKPAYFTVEPYGRHHALHIFADPMPDYALDTESPDVLYFGAGEHDVGMIEMRSNQTLFLDEGAVVYACVHAIDAENIRILGRGILDNSRNRERILFPVNAEGNNEAVKNAERTHTVELEYCRNVLVDGITVRDSLVYNIRPVGCEELVIRHVKIIGCWRFNSDGIDMHNCVNVHISDCFLRTFDDSICVKGFDCYYDGDVEEAVKRAMYRGGKAYDVFRNVLVERCVIWNDWGKALEIGAETRAEEISCVTFRDCDIIHLTGAALDCMNVDYADVHDVTFTDINIEADEVIPKPCIQKNDAETYENPDPDYMPCTICAQVVFHHEYSAGDGRRGRNRDLVFRNINMYGDKLPRVKFEGYDEAHKTENVLISNLCLNGAPLPSFDAIDADVGAFTEHIRMEIDPYAQMDKNTVSAEGQLKENACVRFDHPDGKGIRVMFVGNSITLHGFRPEVGWYHEWGMAASARERDYVHLLEDAILARDPEAAFCLCQVAAWERDYVSGAKLPLYDAARQFSADVIVFRFVENVKKDGYDEEVFLSAIRTLRSHLDETGSARLIVTTGFWRHPGDGALRAYAKECGAPCVELGDLGEDDRMKAVGRFAHRGVASHPGDAGMQSIADRIMEAFDG
ncbi:MAG: hypothetical protein J6B77_06020 [Clostridia bacterium]|nr:hypothetical protein [Clostridia bacterium]